MKDAKLGIDQPIRDLVSGVTILTKPGQNGFTIDAGIGEKLGSKTTITINGTEEIIHTSCSAIYVAGAPAPLDGNTPNPAGAEKGDPSPNWEVVDFREKDDDYVAEAPSLSEAMDACSIPYEDGSFSDSNQDHKHKHKDDHKKKKHHK